MILSIDLFLLLFLLLDGPAGPGRLPGGGEETAGVLREEDLEDPPYRLRCLEATYFYIISGIRGPRMPRRRVSWLSTVPWGEGRRGGRPEALERLVQVVLLG